MPKKGRSIRIRNDSRSESCANITINNIGTEVENDLLTVTGYISCQKSEFEFEDRIVKVSVRQLHLFEMCSGLTPSGNSFFKDELQVGQLKEVSRSESDTESSRRAGISANARANKAELKGKAEIGLSAEAKVAHRGRHERELQTEITRVRRISSGWRIGLEQGGDPIRGIHLDGLYMEHKPWANYEIENGRKACEVKYQAKCSLAMLQIEVCPLEKIANRKKPIFEVINERLFPNKMKNRALKEFLFSLSAKKHVEKALGGREASVRLSAASVSLIEE